METVLTVVRNYAPIKLATLTNLLSFSYNIFLTILICNISIVVGAYILGAQVALLWK